MELLSDMLQAVNPSDREVCEIIVFNSNRYPNRGVKYFTFFPFFF